MKKVRMIVSAVAVFAIVGSALAFSGHKNGAYLCQSSSGTCTSTTKYKIDTQNGTSMFCNDGAGGSSCTTSRTVVQDAN